MSQLPTQARTDSHCILVVDDHELVRSLLVEVLRSANYRVVEADSGPAALAVIEDLKTDIQCIIQDMSMPVMSGPETIQRALAVLPAAKILVLSVDDAETVAQQLGDLPIAGYLEKPCDTDELLKKVASIVA